MKVKKWVNGYVRRTSGKPHVVRGHYKTFIIPQPASQPDKSKVSKNKLPLYIENKKKGGLPSHGGDKLSKQDQARFISSTTYPSDKDRLRRSKYYHNAIIIVLLFFTVLFGTLCLDAISKQNDIVYVTSFCILSIIVMKLSTI